MANYTRQTQTFRSITVNGIELPVIVVGAHQRTYKGVQSLALTGTAATLTVPEGATHADIYCEGAASTDYCRYWHGSTDPTTSVGVKLKEHEQIATASPSNFRAIEVSGSITLRVEYYAYE